MTASAKVRKHGAANSAASSGAVPQAAKRASTVRGRRAVSPLPPMTPAIRATTTPAMASRMKAVRASRVSCEAAMRRAVSGPAPAARKPAIRTATGDPAACCPSRSTLARLPMTRTVTATRTRRSIPLAIASRARAVVNLVHRAPYSRRAAVRGNGNLSGAALSCAQAASAPGNALLVPDDAEVAVLSFAATLAHGLTSRRVHRQLRVRALAFVRLAHRGASRRVAPAPLGGHASRANMSPRQERTRPIVRAHLARMASARASTRRAVPLGLTVIRNSGLRRWRWALRRPIPCVRRSRAATTS